MSDLDHAFDSMRLLMYLARGHSLTDAAAELHYSRSHSGRLVKTLAEELGTQLTVHSDDGIKLTDEGANAVAFGTAMLCGMTHLRGSGPTSPLSPGCHAVEATPCVGIGDCGGRSPHGPRARFAS